jgi:hypothetical protein
LAALTLVLLAAAITYLAGWWPLSGPHPSDEPPLKIAPHSDSFAARHLSYYLRPVPTDQPGPRPTAQEAWDGLFPGMAADPATRDLLQRLYGGLPVEFVVLDKEAAANDTALTGPPREGFPVALRVANLGTHGDAETIFGLINLGRATLIKDMASPETTEGVVGLIKAMQERPLDGEAFDLAVEDYLLRHGTGWLVVRGRVLVNGAKLPNDPREHRADLDRRIEAFATKSADYYDKLRGKR